MTTTPAIQPAPGPYNVSALAGEACGYWINGANGQSVAHVSTSMRSIRLERGDEWDKNVEPYAAYRERIQPELARELETRAATARLLAASWDLLEAARKVADHLDARLDDAVARRVPVPVFQGIVELRAAIAKAEAP